VKILVISAHPDDEVLGCGGTMARLTREGHDVHVLILCTGLESRGPTTPADINSIEAQARRAAHILGAKTVDFERLPDNRFDSVDLLDIVRAIEKRIHTLNPDWIFTQHGGDLNIDHGITFRATLTAARPVDSCPAKALYTFEVPSSTEWALQKITPVFEPNTFFDIAATLPVKLEAMAAYASEMRPYPHPRSREGLEAVAKRWGTVSGYHAAEAFQLIWAKY
jgi:LmbE family N-acetylglucosaminyl deacetylase